MLTWLPGDERLSARAGQCGNSHSLYFGPGYFVSGPGAKKGLGQAGVGVLRPVAPVCLWLVQLARVGRGQDGDSRQLSAFPPEASLLKMASLMYVE